MEKLLKMEINFLYLSEIISFKYSNFLRYKIQLVKILHWTSGFKNWSISAIAFSFCIGN